MCAEEEPTQVGPSEKKKKPPIPTIAAAPPARTRDQGAAAPVAAPKRAEGKGAAKPAAEPTNGKKKAAAPAANANNGKAYVFASVAPVMRTRRSRARHSQGTKKATAAADDMAATWCRRQWQRLLFEQQQH